MKIVRMKSLARHGWQFVSNSGGGREHSARRLKFAMLPRLTQLALADDDGLQFLIRTDDLVIGRDLYTGVSHEVGVHTMTSVIEAVRQEAGSDFLTGKVFLDIGANIGTSSVAAVKRFGAGRAVSVEPSPDNIRLLNCNVALNDLQEQVTVIQAAVSNTEGELRLELNPLNQGDNRVRVTDAAGEFGEDEWETVTVPARRADDIVAELGLRPSDVGLVWIDVQGFEAQVLESATTLLGKVPFVVEYAPYWMERAGGLELFAKLVSESVRTIVDLRVGKRYPAADFDEIAANYRDNGLWTDLALLP